jgi:autotransporter translocation and assembly factor TamB
MKPQRNKQQRSRHRLRMFFLLTLLVGLLFSGAILRWINVPVAQQYVLTWISANTEWSIAMDAMEWRPFTSSIDFQNVTVIHRKNSHYGHLDQLELKYNPFALLRGTLLISKMHVTGLEIRTEKMPPPTEKRERLGLKKILLLQNIEVRDGLIDRATFQLPNHRTLHIAKTRLSFDPAFFGDVRVNIDMTASTLSAGEQIITSAKRISLAGMSDLRAWVNDPHYMNDIRGALTVKLFRWQDITIDDLTASTEYRNSRIALETFRAQLNGHDIEGRGFLDIAAERSALSLAWPEPIELPELLRPASFMTMAGKVTGSLDWEGNSFDPEKLTGSIKMHVAHTPATVTDIPASLTADGAFTQGNLTLKEATLRVGEGSAAITGGIDIGKKQIAIDFVAQDIPILGVLGRFRDDDFHPVAGIADCTGSFRGWAREYAFDLDVKNVRNGAYQDIVLDDLTMTMHQTHPNLTLHGEILQSGRTTGTIDLVNTFGEQLPDGTRATSITLTADIKNHQLDPSFEHVELTGVGQGSIAITGPTTNYTGRGEFTIADGSLTGVPIESFITTIALRPRTLTFQPSELKMPNFPRLAFPGQAIMKIEKGFRLRGNPAPNFSIDIEYQSPNKTWTYHEIRYQDPRLSAPFIVTGNGVSGKWNLTLGGVANGEWLGFFPESFREAAGPLPLNLRVQGNLDKPSISGTVALNGNRVVFRDAPQEWDELIGTLRFEGHRIHYPPIKGLLGDGPFTLTGWMEHDGLDTYPRMDLRLEGQSLTHTFTNFDLRTEFDADLHITRADGKTTHVNGDIALVEGYYTKNFRVLDQVAQRAAAIKRAELRDVKAGFDDILLDLHVESRGEILIRNNAAELALRATLDIEGTSARPKIRGTIRTTEGVLHYLGIAFEVTNGSIEFHPPLFEPFLDITGEETVGTHLVQLVLRGPMENLQVELQSIPGEDRKDVLCLLAYGSTCDQLRYAQFGSKVGPGVFMEQVGRILEQPISALTGLDVVRVESATGSANFSQLHLGKRLSDRLEVSFVTSVGQTATDQSLEAAYQLTDNVLIKALQSNSNQSQLNLSLRFRER